MTAKEQTKAALTPKQQAFVEEYLKDLNGTQAAIRAGYSKKTANEQAVRILANVSVRSAIDEAKKARSERTEITQDYVLSSIVDTIERCKQVRQVFNRKGEPVLVETPDGVLAPAFVFDAQSVLKGADLLAKHLGLYEKDNEQKPPTVILMEQITTSPNSRIKVK